MSEIANVGAVSTLLTNQANQTTAASDNNNVDYDTFLKLLVAQLKTQDPTNPTDSTEFLSQLASFSGVEQQVQTNNKLDALLTASQLGQATNLIGKTITYNGGSLDGVVSAVSLEQGGTVIAQLVNGQKVPINEGVVISNE
ncbi:MAG: flagellar hook assembly protein FlgD [Rhizobiaceae bacterium]|nr:flagellar hook assembly protein FlgD [Rhizobiaceae bacterium]